MSYKTITYLPDSSQAYTTVTFSLSRHDWCELEKTIEWVNFVKILEKYQNKKGNMGAKMFESISSGKSTINKARASFGLDPIEGGNLNLTKLKK